MSLPASTTDGLSFLNSVAAPPLHRTATKLRAKRASFLDRAPHYRLSNPLAFHSDQSD
jgi:hypothetical protein